MRGSLILLLPALAWANDFEKQFESIKREASPKQLYALLYDMPKGGDLHHHLGLSFLAADLWAGATDSSVTKGSHFYTRLKINGCDNDPLPHLRFLHIDRTAYSQLNDCLQGEFKALPSLTEKERAAWTSSMVLDRDGEGRNEFFEVIVRRISGLVRNPALLQDQIVRMLRRYEREKILYLETQASSSLEQFQATRNALLGPEASKLSISVRLQKTMVRFLPESEKLLMESYAHAASNRDLVVGINMAGREDNDKGHALRFLDTFRQMRRTYSGIHLSIHAGEKDSPGREVRDTLFLGAERIGHAVNLISDPETMIMMRNGRNLIETSLVSNHLLEYTPDISKHPFPEYLRFGIPVCLNTDDAGVWDSQLTDDYFLAVRHFNLTWREVVELGRNSLQYSFAEPQLKDRLLKVYAENVTAFEQKYSGNEWRGKIDRVSPPITGYARRKLNLQ